jgi:cytochrome b involved in lipid metabolism
MSSDIEIGVNNFVTTKDKASFISTDTATSSSQDQIERIRKQVEKLQGIERGISKSSRTLTVEKRDSSLSGTAAPSCDSLHFSRRGSDSFHFSRRASFQKPEEPDETVQKIRKEVRRLQDLQQGLILAGDSKSTSKMLRTSASMSLTPEQFKKQQEYARRKKYSAIAFGVVILAGVVAGVAVGIVSLVSFVKDDEKNDKGGNTPSTLQEVALHATTDDCWAAIHDSNVYDLTDWVDDHPGGSIFIEAICGKEGTDLFSTEHPSSWLNEHGVQFRVGPLVAATEDPQVATPPNETQYPQTTDAPVAAGITLDEVALHNTPQDIWAALYGNIRLDALGHDT